MKRYIAILMVAILILPIFGCGKKIQPLSASSGEYNYLMEFVEADEHTHEIAEKPQIVSDPITGYCGNIITRIVKEDQEESFCYGDSVTLTDLVINLDYSKPMCKCASEFLVYVETEKEPYEVNLSQAFVRFGGKHAELTEEQVNTVQGIVNKYFPKEEISNTKLKPVETPIASKSNTP